MTNLDQAAAALDTAAEALAAAALALRAEASQDAPGAASFDDLPFDDYEGRPAEEQPAQHGSAAVCPAHNIPYRDGRYGPYCPSTSDIPRWFNEKGYCTVTPKSAAAYLRQKAAG